MYGQSNAILDPKTGETLMYSELLKGNRITMPSGYAMHPQSGKLHVDNGEDINLVELLLQHSSCEQDGTGGEKEWRLIKEIVLEEDVDVFAVSELNIKECVVEFYIKPTASAGGNFILCKRLWRK